MPASPSGARSPAAWRRSCLSNGSCTRPCATSTRCCRLSVASCPGGDAEPRLRLFEVLADESEVEADDVSPRLPEAGGCEAVLHPIRVDRREGVVRVRRTHRLEVQGVLPDEDAPGPQDPMQLGEQ